MVKLFALLKKDDTDEQLCYYQVCFEPPSACSGEIDHFVSPALALGFSLVLFRHFSIGEQRSWISLSLGKFCSKRLNIDHPFN